MKKTMKKALAALVCAAIVPGTLAAWQCAGDKFTDKRTLTRTSGNIQTLIAHRGYSAKYPQNTLAAFIAAAQEGFDGFHFEIHTTKDDVWVAMFFDTLDEMTDGTGKISDYTYEELQKFTINEGNGLAQYPDQKIPSLDQALAVCDRYSIFPVIEIRSCENELQLPAVLRAVYDHGLGKKAVLMSDKMEYLALLRELDPEIRMLYLSNQITKEEVDQCAALGNTGVSVNYRNISKMKDALKYACEKGLERAAWTVDYPILADYCHLNGIDVILTNRIMHKSK